MKSGVGEPRGILNHAAGKKKFQHERYQPSPKCSFFIQHFWIVEWDLVTPYVQEVLPHPSVHVVFENNASRIVGVMKGKFTRILLNRGLVFGIKFRPGAFYPFINVPVSRWTNKIIDLTPQTRVFAGGAEIFGQEIKMLENDILSQKNHLAMVERAEQFLTHKLPIQDENITLVNRLVDFIMANREVTKVDDIVHQFNIHKRTLQRLFSQYVGVNAKWVINRYRLHEVIERIAAGDTIDWSALALELGYFDQAHFIKDFKSIVGKSPQEYKSTTCD